jgi:hypothetical protein
MASFFGLITRRSARRLATKAAVDAAAEAAHRQVSLYEERDALTRQVNRLRTAIGDMRLDAVLISGMIRDDRLSVPRRIGDARKLLDLMVRIADKAVPR